MIHSIEDAWRWYQSVEMIAKMMDRIAGRYWNEKIEEKTLKETLFRDDVLKEYDAAQIQALAKDVRADLNDFAVLLLFSVFEAEVRERTRVEMDRELATPLRHPALIKAVADARYAVEHGSFGRLTEAYRTLDPDIKTQVDQVRNYRNWVAHGRRGEPVKVKVDPVSALKRLEAFLKLLDAASVERVPEPPDA